MNARILSTAAVLLMAALPLLAEEAPSAALRVHVPRTMKIDSDTIKLGEVCVLRSSDEELSAKAAAIPLGRAPFVKEEIRIDRNTILSRLAANGIASSSVTLTGAQTVVVTRNESVVDGAELVHAAEAFLAEDRPLPPQTQWKLQGPVPDLAIHAKEEITLECRLKKDNAQGNPRVEVAVFSGRNQLEARELAFTLCHQVRRITATKEILSGDMITPENVKVETIASEVPLPWVSPFGMTAAQRIGSGAVINLASLKQPQVAIAVRRGQTVVMKIEGAGFVVTTLGQVADDGKPGDCVKVRNIDSNRMVIARVNADGTVTPLSTSNEVN
jgi:flagella basal body P-ring formation protein FlgA